MANRFFIDATSARMHLPLLALHCLRSAAATEHARANVLCQRSAGEHSRNQKRRSRRMSVAGRRAEAEARDIAAEVRS